jgi:peroxidase
VGQAQCQNFRARIYNESNIDAAFAATRRAGCPATGGGGGALAPLDASTPNAFDNGYYGNLVAQRGLLHSDQQLFSGGSTDSLVRSYAASPAQFQSDFAAAMVKMGGIGVLTGSSGPQVRRNCRRVN